MGEIHFLFRREMPISSDGVKKLVGDLVFSSEKIQTELDFTPRYDLNQGIQLTVEWYLKQKE